MKDFGPHFSLVGEKTARMINENVSHEQRERKTVGCAVRSKMLYSMTSLGAHGATASQHYPMPLATAPPRSSF